MVCYQVERKRNREKKGRLIDMKRTNLILMTAVATFTFVGCGQSGNDGGGEVITYKLTPKQVWEQKCHKCHGEKAEGLTKKKTPPMNDRQAGELELDLFDVKNEGISMSSGTDHDKMAHNMQKLLEQGFNYDPTAMAKFIEKNFYIGAEAAAKSKAKAKEASATEEKTEVSAEKP
jgi:cytochrome c553